MIRADRISHVYTDTEVLSDASVTAGPGEVVGLIGPNGSGKTTLLRMLYRALTPTAGIVVLDDQPIGDMPSRALARAVAVVVQDSAGDLPLSVTDTVLLGRTPHLRSWQRESGSDIEIAAEALQRVGATYLAHRDFSELSGGEKQRVLIARALAQQATHLLLDEPTNHLDIHYQHEVLRLIRELGVTTILVLHDLNLAARYCDNLVLLDRGGVAATGTVDAVLRPEVLEPVYGVHIQRVIADDGRAQLLFRTLDGQRPGNGRTSQPDAVIPFREEVHV